MTLQSHYEPANLCMWSALFEMSHPRCHIVFLCNTIRTNCNLRVAFSLNSWIYNKKVIIQLTVQYRHIFRLVPTWLYLAYRLVQYGSHLGICAKPKLKVYHVVRHTLTTCTNCWWKSFVRRSFIPSFICSFTHSFIVRSLVRSFIRSIN